MTTDVCDEKIYVKRRDVIETGISDTDAIDVTMIEGEN